MLEIANLSFKRNLGTNNFQILLPSLRLVPGQVATIKGPSGCGKSTLLEIIGLILQADSVEKFQLQDLDLAKLLVNTGHKQSSQTNKILSTIRASYLGFMLQNGGLLPFLTVKENINLSNLILKTIADKPWLEALISKLNLQHLVNKYPRQLSIGERQRVSFIRSVAHKPKLLLCDEPTAALDPANALKLTQLIVELVHESNIAAIIVTHQDSFTAGFDICRVVAQLQQEKTTFIQQSEKPCNY